MFSLSLLKQFNLSLLMLLTVSFLAACNNEDSITNETLLAINQSVRTPQNTPVSVTLPASDADNIPLTYIVSNPANGNLSGQAPNLIYTPNNNFVGEDIVTFTANNGTTVSNEATIRITVTLIDGANLGHRTGQMYQPYFEWSVTNSSFSGNPFDLVAEVTFTHENTSKVRKTEMFYDGNNTWKFRFSGTQLGNWSFVSNSADGNLHGRFGTLTVNSNPNAHGFLKKFSNKWGWEGTEDVFVPQYVMWNGSSPSFANPIEFHNNPTLIDDRIEEYMIGHGFTGFHMDVLGGRWFDINHSSNSVLASMINPDIRTFEALELLITKTHAAGGAVHFWPWGDNSRSQTPLRLAGGANGTEDQRLQRYIAARLGPLPGWSISYGFDLFEWTNNGMLNTWYAYMQDHFGWSHFMGGRASTNQLDQIFEGFDYSSYEWHQPDYDDYVDHISARPENPSFSEDRFRIRAGNRSKDYDATKTRRGLWHSTMAGGVANIWGHYPNGPIAPYPNKSALKTYAEFFVTHKRFLESMIRDNVLSSNSDTRVLRDGDDKLVVYREDTTSIDINLTGMSASQVAIAVNTLGPYEEIALGTLNNTQQTINLPFLSDWAIAIGTFD